MEDNNSVPSEHTETAPLEERRRRVIEFLETEVWPTIPARYLGQIPTRAAEDEILGYLPDPAKNEQA